MPVGALSQCCLSDRASRRVLAAGGTQRGGLCVLSFTQVERTMQHLGFTERPLRGSSGRKFSGRCYNYTAVPAVSGWVTVVPRPALQCQDCVCT